MLILVLNCGSSSVKYQLYDMPKEQCLDKGAVEEIGKKASPATYNAAVRLIIRNLLKSNTGAISLGMIKAIGHRVVHGGEQFKRSVLINKRVIKAIKQYSRLAPLHNPSNLAGILAAQRLFPRVPGVAVFDTAFHQSMPESTYLYGLPYSIYKRYGIRRYGFHGTSHRYVASRVSKILGRPGTSLKIISCHLGNGCSITAIDKGKSIDTSMGFTPLEGLMMGTRTGDIDAAAVLYLMRKKRLSIARTDRLLNQSSGLLGLSGQSNDMRDIMRLAGKGHKRAQIAVEVFVYRIKKYIAAYMGAMNGCDVLVFTAGIGENQPLIRKKVSRGLSALLKKFKTRMLVVPANEELMIARDTYQLTR
jgi:acetate kinase